MGSIVNDEQLTEVHRKTVEVFFILFAFMDLTVDVSVAGSVEYLH